MKNVSTFLGAIIVIVTLVVGLKFVGFNIWAYFGPKEAAVERQIFEGTKVYNDGMVRDLENLMMEYKKSSKEEKVSLREVVLHRFSVYPIEKLPSNLKSFYIDLKSDAQGEVEGETK